MASIADTDATTTSSSNSTATTSSTNDRPRRRDTCASRGWRATCPRSGQGCDQNDASRSRFRATGSCHPPHGDSQLQAITPSLAVPLPTVTVHCFGVAVMLALVTVAVNDAGVPAIDVVFPIVGLKIVDDSAAV